jgi:chromosome partitioning protein
VPSSLDLAGLELVLMNTIGRETVLKSFLAQFTEDYDYILVDCLPSLGIFTVNALTASSEIIIPVQAQYFGAKGVEALLQSVNSVQTYLNGDLKVAGILITMLDGRSSFQQEVRQILGESFGDYTKIFSMAVPMSVAVSKLQSQGTPIVAIKNNRVSKAYSEFAKELINHE